MATRKIKNVFGWLAAATIVVNLVAAYFLIPPTPSAKAQLGSVQTWAGNATGTNSITISLHNIASLNDLLGVPIRFVPAAINTSSVTITINLDGGGTLGPVNVLKPSTGSLVAFVGGEFQASQIATVAYDGTEFQCTGCTAAVAAGTTADYSGVTIPSGWLKADGSAISRTAQPALFNALVFSGITATTTNTSTSVVVASSANYQVGWFVGGANVSCNTNIVSIPDGTHIVLGTGASASGSTTLTIGPYPQGDCSTTFNIPNYAGKVTAGVDGSTNITSATCTNPSTIGDKQSSQTCGGQTQTLTLAQLPTGINTSGTVSVSGSVAVGGLGTVPTSSTWSAISVNLSGGNAAANSSGTLSPVSSFSGSMSGTNSMTSTNTSGAAHPILQSTSLTYKIIKT